MEVTKNSEILRETNDNKSNIPDGIGVADDSGFASIAGSIADGPSRDDPEGLSIAADVKFRSVDVAQMQLEKAGKRKYSSRAETSDENKKVDDDYANEKREQIYKRLMHLLTKSQFYSNYIVDKINGKANAKVLPKKKTRQKRGDASIDEDYEPLQRSQRIRTANKRYNIREYVSTDMKKKLVDQKKKMNLSQEDIEAELIQNSDMEETSPEAGVSAAFENPTYFHGELRDYQIVGLKWLKVLYENGVNGILADEMGLGKTIQVIALFAHLLEKRQDGPYLIIAPLSTIPNWLMEFERFAPQLPVVLFHGQPENRAVAEKKIKKKQKVTDDYSTYPIVLTTYEVPLKESYFITRFKWRYIVIDEGHRIKNHECQLAHVLRRCESMNRLLLTGTPLQNNLAELWSLLNFLLPEIFDDLAVFESWFDANELQQDDGTLKVLKQEEEKQVLSTLREILKPFMLRRVKTEVCLDIPPKKELIVYAPMTELQHDLYAAILNRDLQMLSKIEEKPLILEDGPSRPKRQCVSRNMYSSNYVDIYNTSGASSSNNVDIYNTSGASSSNNVDNISEDGSSRSATPMSEGNDDFDWSAYRKAEANRAHNQGLYRTEADKNLDIWRQYADVNIRNQDFFIRLRFGNNGPMYRQIVNHPYLMHCPLDAVGRPLIHEEMVKASGKLLVLDAMLRKLKARGHKVLLFSTSTMLLDLVADYLSMRPWRFLMLSGRDKIELRQENIKLFNNDPDMFLFLISTRAGGVGLNLASADTVIMYDSDWNPQADIQAMARCHRIGQTRPVVIYRLCTKGTIDERIITRAEAKRKLEKMVISKKTELDLKDASTLKELKRLLDSTEQVVVKAEKEVYTEAELDKILDRSDLMPSKPEAAMSTEESDSS